MRNSSKKIKKVIMIMNGISNFSGEILSQTKRCWLKPASPACMNLSLKKIEIKQARATNGEHKATQTDNHFATQRRVHWYWRPRFYKAPLSRHEDTHWELAISQQKSNKVEKCDSSEVILRYKGQLIDWLISNLCINYSS